MSSSRTVGLVATHAVAATLLIALVVGQVTQRFDPVNAIPGFVLIGSLLVTGWVLSARLPRNPIGWVLLAITSVFAAGPIAVLAGHGLASTAPGVTGWLYWFAGDGESNWTWLLAVWPLLIWIPLHFPDGRVPSPRWWWFSWLTAALLVIAVFLFATGIPTNFGVASPAYLPAVLGLQEVLIWPVALLAVASFVGTVVSLVSRYRGGDVLLRAQLRWMVWAVAIATFVLAGNWVVSATIGDIPVLNAVSLALYALIPVAIAIAVLRYRLYEIDRIISRTAAYAIVTVVVVGTYAAGVLLASVVVGETVGTAIGTLAAAAIFLPVLRWARRGVDRVFNRSVYDAERVVVAFGEQIRNGADPHTAGADLLSAVESTLHPSAVGLWVRP